MKLVVSSDNEVYTCSPYYAVPPSMHANMHTSLVIIKKKTLVTIVLRWAIW